MHIRVCRTYNKAEQYLDETFGQDWHWKVDLYRLNQNDPVNCLIGQLSPRARGCLAWSDHGVFGITDKEAGAVGVAEPNPTFRNMVITRRRAECLSEPRNEKSSVVVEFEDGWRANYASVSDIPHGRLYKVV